VGTDIADRTENSGDETPPRGEATDGDSPPASEDPAEQEVDTARKTGRGFLIITAAKVWFMITSAVIQLGLPIFFGSAEKFGVFKIVTESISLINMVMITGTLQAVSKLVSEQPARARRVVDRAVKLQFALGVPIAGLYALGSPWIAASFNDPSLTPLIRLSSLIIAFYAFYAIFVGYLNGVKEFVRQASLDMTFATLKMIGIVGLVLLGFGVVGAVVGFVGASAIICGISAVMAFLVMRSRSELVVESEAEGEATSTKRVLGYLVSVMLFNFALNGLMRVDLFVLKSIAADAPAHLESASALFSTISNKFSGFYGAVLNVARIPYQGVIAVTFVIFPLISESTFEEDVERTRSYIRDTLRYCLLLIAPLGLALAFNADSIIGALYAPEYQTASVALAILAVAVVFFAMLYVATTIIVGSGHPMHAVAIMGGSLGLSALLNYLFVSRIHAQTMQKLADIDWSPLGETPTGAAPELARHAVATAQNQVELSGPYMLEATVYMQYAAVATAIAMFVGFAASLVWLLKTYGAAAPPATALRILLAAGLFALLDWSIPLPPDWVELYGRLQYFGLVAGKMALSGSAILILLFITGEFGREDMDRLKSVLGVD